MAIALVQQVASVFTSTTFASNTTTGNAILVFLTGATGLPSPNQWVRSVTDGTNTYTRIYAAKDIGGTTYKMEVWACFNITGAVTPTVTGVMQSGCKMVLMEVSGLAKVQPVDYVTVNFMGARSGGAFTMNTQNTKTANNLVVLMANILSGLTVTFTGGAGYSNVLLYGSNVNNGSAIIQSKITSSQAPVSGSTSHASNTNTGIMMAVFSDTDLPPYKDSPNQFNNNYQQLIVGDGMSVSEKIR